MLGEKLSMHIGGISTVVASRVVSTCIKKCLFFLAGRTSSGQKQPKNRHYLEQGHSTVDIIPKTRAFITEKIKFAQKEKWK